MTSHPFHPPGSVLESHSLQVLSDLFYTNHDEKTLTRKATKSYMLATRRQSIKKTWPTLLAPYEANF